MNSFSIDARQRDMSTAFKQADIDTAQLDARVLMRGVTKLNDCEMIIMGERALTPAEMCRADAWQQARLDGKPVSRILGRREFYGLNLVIDENVLDPRPDSEIMVDAVLQSPMPENIYVLDMGTGSGALLLAVLANAPKSWRGLGLDCSFAALAVAQKNAKLLGLNKRCNFICGDWGQSLQHSTAQFDVILANPPYIAAQELAVLPVAVRDYDPYGALYGGFDGLRAYANLLGDAAHLLKPDGMVLLEIGNKQAACVQALMQQAGLRPVRLLPDLAGRDRVVIGVQKMQKKQKRV
ncbi:MAG: peptide chain release factor N(5)-glutamine methyltransferase [Parvibaculales bacterium]